MSYSGQHFVFSTTWTSSSNSRFFHRSMGLSKKDLQKILLTMDYEFLIGTGLIGIGDNINLMS